MPNVKVAMAEFFKLLLNGTTADDALHTIVKERDVLRRLLICTPKAPKESKGGGKEREPLPRKSAGKRPWSGQETTGLTRGQRQRLSAMASKLGSASSTRPASLFTVAPTALRRAMAPGNARSFDYPVRLCAGSPLQDLRLDLSAVCRHPHSGKVPHVLVLFASLLATV